MTTQTIFEEKKLNEVAEKFGKIPASYSKKADIIAAGFMTEDEFNNLPFCPRSKAMESATKWPFIGGRKTYPLSGALNQEERTMYFAYKKNHLPGTSSSGSSSPKTEETIKELLELRNDLIALKAPESSIAKIDKIIQSMPKKKLSIIEQLFGVPAFSMLGGKVSVLYVMYRDKEGNFFKTLQPKPGEDITYDAMSEPVFTKAQILDNLKKLKAAGTDLSACFTDWNPVLD
jgi:hypothetical protein